MNYLAIVMCHWEKTHARVITIWEILIPQICIDFHDRESLHVQENYCKISFSKVRITTLMDNTGYKEIETLLIEVINRLAVKSFIDLFLKHLEE